MVKSTRYNSRPAALGTLLTYGVLCFLPSVQAANAVCKSDWGWSYNSKGQNPCEIAASLQGPCLGQANFELLPLEPGNLYANPKKNTPLRKKCGCNTVIFSLFMACTLCQGSVNTQTWTGWSQFCDGVYVTQYPIGIPPNATVPHWAYLDYTKEDRFNPTFAQSVGRDPETTATATSTYRPPTLTASNEGGEQESGSKTNVGAIAGSVIGGVAGLVAIAALVLLFRKRRQKTQQAHIIDLNRATGAEWETTAMKSTHKLQRLYDPSDPSTFPDPVLVNGENSTPSQANNTPVYLGKYTGSAEV